VQLASVETTQGPDAQESRRLRAEIESLQGQLRLALQQRLEELRQQLSTLGQSTAELSGKIAAQQQAMADQLNDSLSPKRSSLQLRLEILGAQLKQIQTRRAEVETYSRLDQPALNITVPVEVGDAPEVRHRGTRQAAALFAALLIGLSLHSILRHQAARRVQPHLHD
jgi:predicted  nucleic acid-binding Zn-ribbon protein